MSEEFSESESNGLVLIGAADKKILSVGISTAGKAEIEMTHRAPKARIIATTIDRNGIEQTKDLLEAQGLRNRIDVKYEDVSEPLDYENASIDFIYARLVLHYLPKQKLGSSLKEMHRILKPGGKLYIVVRSTKCDAAKQPENTYDESTGMTTFREKGTDAQPKFSTRFFHTVETISSFVEKYFSILSVNQYDESLFKDFARSIPADWQDNVIELIAEKG